MGAMKQLKQEKLDRRRRREGKPRERANWNTVEPGIVRDFILVTQWLDGAVRFGRSRDGAVYSIGFYIGDERFTEWVRAGDAAADDFATLFDEIIEDYAVPDDFRE